MFSQHAAKLRMLWAANGCHATHAKVTTVPRLAASCMQIEPGWLAQNRDIGASVPTSTFMCLWANYIFPRWVCLFCWRKYVHWTWEYINRSRTHECENSGWGRAIPRKGIYKRNCRCSALSLNLLPLYMAGCLPWFNDWDGPFDQKINCIPVLILYALIPSLKLISWELNFKL